MARPAAELRSSDITVWGLAALGAVAFALLSISMSAMLPPSFFVGLHASRIEGGDANAMRAEIAQLLRESTDLRRANETLSAQMFEAEQNRAALVQRISGLESTIPNLLEAIPADQRVDTAIVTAGIGDDKGETRPAEGGEIRIVRTPMFSDSTQPMPPQQMPAQPASEQAQPAETAAAGQQPVSPEPARRPATTSPAVVIGIAVGPPWKRATPKRPGANCPCASAPCFLGLNPASGPIRPPATSALSLGRSPTWLRPRNCAPISTASASPACPRLLAVDRLSGLPWPDCG